MYVYVWEYRVRPEAAERFRETYGPEGEWVALFRRASGYVETRLCQDVADPHRYLTIDTWESLEAYQRFRASYSAEFTRLDAECESLTLQELRVGEFSLVD